MTALAESWFYGLAAGKRLRRGRWEKQRQCTVHHLAPADGERGWGWAGRDTSASLFPPSCCNQKRFDLTNVAGWSSNTECWHSAPKMMGWCQAVMTLMRSQLYEFSTWKARWNVSIIRWIYFTCLSRKEPMETHDTFGAPKSDFLTTAGSAR